MTSCELSTSHRRWLLAWARQSIQDHLNRQSQADPPTIPAEVEVRRGVFATLHLKSGPLRGCIGTFNASEPLWMTTGQMAIQAATQDPRFPALTPFELTQCTLELSVLGPRKPITPDKIQVGNHGLWVSTQSHRGVLLPQVAVEHGWDSEKFLSETCLKARMPPHAWKDDNTTIEAFTAEVFGEPVG